MEKQELVARKNTSLIEHGTAVELLKISSSELIPTLTYKQFWIMDFLAWKILKEYKLMPKDKTLESITPEDLEKFEEYYESLSGEELLEIYSLYFTSREFKEHYHLERNSRFSNKKIFKLVDSAAFCRYISPRYYFPEENTWIRIRRGESVFDYKAVEIGRISNKTKEPEWRFKISFSKKEALSFLQNVRNGKFTIMPLSFYKLLGGKEQTLFRSIVWMPPKENKKTGKYDIPAVANINLERGCNIVGIKNKNLTIRQKEFEKVLDNLKKAMYFKSWKKKTEKGVAGKLIKIDYKLVKSLEIPVC